MRIQYLLNPSLKLVLPERLARRLRGVAHRTNGPPHQLPDPIEVSDLALRRAQMIIKDLDHGYFGGPSFSPQTMQLMAQALQEIHRTDALPGPLTAICGRSWRSRATVGFYAGCTDWFRQR